MERIVLPGDLIGEVDEFDLNVSSDGYYSQQGKVYASRCGLLNIKCINGKNKRISVSNFVNKGDIIPAKGDIVEGLVKNIGIRFCNIEITAVNGQNCKTKFNAVLRKENMRKTEIDRIVISECFRPHDLIRAKVVSLGSIRSYELSTADVNFGVVKAKAYLSSEDLIPVSWNEMKCPVTGEIEKRKVAKLL